MGLTNKQRVFIERYLTHWNATQAAVEAGYSPKTAHSIGHENLKKPEIADEIERRVAEKCMTADEVLVRLAEQARADISDFFTIEEERIEPDEADDDEIEDDEAIEEFVKALADGRSGGKTRQIIGLDLLKAKRLGKTHLVKSITFTKQGPKIEMYDAQAALQLIGKHLGLFKDHSINLNLTKDELAGMPDDELDRLIDRLTRGT